MTTEEVWFCESDFANDDRRFCFRISVHIRNNRSVDLRGYESKETWNARTDELVLLLEFRQKAVMNDGGPPFYDVEIEYRTGIGGRNALKAARILLSHKTEEFGYRVNSCELRNWSHDIPLQWFDFFCFLSAEDVPGLPGAVPMGERNPSVEQAQSGPIRVLPSLAEKA